MSLLQLEIEPSESTDHYDTEEGAPFLSKAEPSVKRPHHYPQLNKWKLLLLLSFLSVVAVRWRPSISSNPTNVPSKREADLIQYQCPTAPVQNAATVDENSKEWYDQRSKQILANVTAFLDVFRKMEYDNWGRSFAEVKQGMYHWKANQFLALRDNMTIYESACGIGLNLFMTLEILQATQGTKNIVVYGNEFVPESVDIAREIAQHLPNGGRLGRICQGDSSHLSYVPSNSFDLVFTGYITPLLDPLQFKITNVNELEAKYTELCESKDPVLQKQNKLAQQRQDDWYAKWMSEMVRIAKPGAPIIVEQVSYPLCEAYFDWGGVNQAFWHNGVRKYGWDVDPNTYYMEDDKIMRRRYHVSVQKNNI